VPFQSKGLIATEAFVTIPRWGLPGAHPAITSHFLEFLPEGAETREARLADELEEGGRYEVLITTAGGLYRYRLGDVVEVTGHWGGLPLLRFMGRADRVSDRFGEKLSDGFVTWALQELCAAEDLDPSFSLLAPEEEGGRTRYVWYLRAGEEEADPGVPGAPEIGEDGGNQVGPRNSRGLQALASRLDEALSANFHYATCRRLGQLDPPELRRVPRDAPLRYLEARGRGGGSLGDVKIPSLEATSGWADVLRASAP